MEGRARGAPLCKKIFFYLVFLVGRRVRRQRRIERIGRREESRDSVAV
jgi:hypothetical protein